MDKKLRITLLIVVLVAILGLIYYFESQKIMPTNDAQKNAGISIISKTDKEEKYTKAIELQNISGYINTEKINITDLIGKKVILVDFWTYSCINCQRTTPYLNAWYEKYKRQGLEIIGVHTPEFDFEKDYNNVAKAVANAGIKYPVVQDNEYATWQAYGNRYWPRKYLIDIDGYIVYDHIGEGGYEETEKKIQELLEELERNLEGDINNIATDIVKPQDVIEMDTSKSRSPEIYFGSLRNEFLSNGKPRVSGIQKFDLPIGVVKNRLNLSGEWNIQDEYSENISNPSEIIFRYEGKAVYFVARSEKGAVIKIGRDGKPLGQERGEDVSDDGSIHIQEDRLYKLINDTEYGEYTLEIIIESGSLQAFTFTFG